MSGARFLLLFIGDDDVPAGWLRLVDGVVVARGTDCHDVASPLPFRGGDGGGACPLVAGQEVLESLTRRSRALDHLIAAR